MDHHYLRMATVRSISHLCTHIIQCNEGAQVESYNRAEAVYAALKRSNVWKEMNPNNVWYVTIQNLFLYISF
jgi:hypothetical protein